MPHKKSSCWCVAQIKILVGYHRDNLQEKDLQNLSESGIFLKTPAGDWQRRGFVRWDFFAVK